MPLSGQTRYLAGLAVRGQSKDTIRASAVAFEGRMKILGGLLDWSGSVKVLCDMGAGVVESIGVDLLVVEAFDRVARTMVEVLLRWRLRVSFMLFRSRDSVPFATGP